MQAAVSSTDRNAMASPRMTAVSCPPDPGMGSMATDERAEPVPFQAHIELLQSFLSRRAPIVDKLQLVLNAQDKPVQYQEDRALLSRQFEDCFFAAPAVSRDQATLRGQLQQAHWVQGFRPRDM